MTPVFADPVLELLFRYLVLSTLMACLLWGGLLALAKAVKLIKLLVS